jgi:uncharacterized protein YlxP (DUF503 family)
MRNRVFIFFYVNNNIILSNYSNKRAVVDKAVEELQKKYTLTRGESLK